MQKLLVLAFKYVYSTVSSYISSASEHLFKALNQWFLKVLMTEYIFGETEGLTRKLHISSVVNTLTPAPRIALHIDNLYCFRGFKSYT